MEKATSLISVLNVFITSVVIGIAGVYINKEYQEKQIELQEMEMLGQFVEIATKASPGERMKLAEYFVTLTSSEELKEKWCDYKDFVVGAEVDSIKTQINILRVIRDSLPEGHRVKIQQLIDSLNESISGNLAYSQEVDFMFKVEGISSEEINKLKREVKRVEAKANEANSNSLKADSNARRNEILSTEKGFNKILAQNKKDEYANFLKLKYHVSHSNWDSISRTEYSFAKQMIRDERPKMLIGLAVAASRQNNDAFFNLIKTDLSENWDSFSEEDKRNSRVDYKLWATLFSDSHQEIIAQIINP